MREIRKLLKLSRPQFYEVHLSLVNCLLPRKITPTEIRVVAAFMALEGDIAIYRFGPSAKKIIMKELNLSPAGLCNYITSLIEKGFLTKTGDVINILPLLIPEKDEQIYAFKLVNMGDVSSLTPLNNTTNGTTATINQDQG